MNEMCRTCKWWNKSVVVNEWGKCRRHPPVLCESLVEFYRDNPDEHEEGKYVEQDLLAAIHGPNPWVWRVTMLDDLCGEWTSRR